MSTDDTTPLEPLGSTTPLPAVPPEATTSLTDDPPVAGSPLGGPAEDEDPGREPVVVDAAPAATTPPDSTAQAVPRPAPARARLRIGTVVWGLVIAALGVGVLAYATGHTIDTQLALIVLLTVAGVTLLVGSLVGSARGSRR